MTASPEAVSNNPKTCSRIKCLMLLVLCELISLLFLFLVLPVPVASLHKHIYFTQNNTYYLFSMQCELSTTA